MDRAGCPVDRLAFTDQLLSFRIIDPARVSQLRRDLLVTIQLRDIRFIPNDYEQLFLAFFALFRRDEDLALAV